MFKGKLVLSQSNNKTIISLVKPGDLNKMPKIEIKSLRKNLKRMDLIKIYFNIKYD